MKKLLNIAVFASGSGSNAEKIARHFAEGDLARVTLIACNNPRAGVLERASRLRIPVYLFDRPMFKDGTVAAYLLQSGIDFVVLAGFLWLVPENLVNAFPDKIVNIHPALLPRHGGKGMYGDKVHMAVVEQGDAESGISIHYVNAHYDEGQIIFQARCPVVPGDTAESVAQKVHALEYLHYPAVIESLLKKL